MNDQRWELGSIEVACGCGYVTHQEAIFTKGGRIVCLMNRYVTEYVPGARLNGVPVLRDSRHVPHEDPVYTRGEPFPYSAEARRIVGGRTAE